MFKCLLVYHFPGAPFFKKSPSFEKGLPAWKGPPELKGLLGHLEAISRITLFKSILIQIYGLQKKKNPIAQNKWPKCNFSWPHQYIKKDIFHLVTSMGQRKHSESPWGIKPQTFRFQALMLYHWATEIVVSRGHYGFQTWHISY